MQCKLLIFLFILICSAKFWPISLFRMANLQNTLVILIDWLIRVCIMPITLWYLLFLVCLGHFKNLQFWFSWFEVNFLRKNVQPFFDTVFDHLAF